MNAAILNLFFAAGRKTLIHMMNRETDRFISNTELNFFDRTLIEYSNQVMHALLEIIGGASNRLNIIEKKINQIYFEPFITGIEHYKKANDIQPVSEFATEERRRGFTLAMNNFIKAKNRLDDNDRVMMLPYIGFCELQIPGRSVGASKTLQQYCDHLRKQILEEKNEVDSLIQKAEIKYRLSEQYRYEPGEKYQSNLNETRDTRARKEFPKYEAIRLKQRANTLNENIRIKEKAEERLKEIIRLILEDNV